MKGDQEKAAEYAEAIEDIDIELEDLKEYFAD